MIHRLLACHAVLCAADGARREEPLHALHRRPERSSATHLRGAEAFPQAGICFQNLLTVRDLGVDSDACP